MSKIDRFDGVEDYVNRIGETDLSEYEPDVTKLIEAGLTIARAGLMASANHVLQKCESPIERIFAACLCKMTWPNSPWVEWEPQVKVGKYRVDFVYTLTEANPPIKVAVELDGHDFHEKTKEQAKRDKEKDRFLQNEGFYVFRFTGSEVYQAPERCMREVIDFASKRWFEIDPDHFSWR